VFRAIFADCLLSDDEHAEFIRYIMMARDWKWRSDIDAL